MSNSHKGNTIKLHDKCPNPKCNCQKIIIFTLHQYMLQGGSIKNKTAKNFSEEQKRLGIIQLNQV